MEFIASLVSSLAWPVAVLTIVVVLRKPIGELVRARLRKFEGFGLRMEFDELSADVREADVQARVELQAEATSVDGRASTTDLVRTVDTAPRDTILRAYEAMVAALRAAVAARRPSENLDELDLDELADLALQDGTVTPASVDSFRGLRIMRNLAANPSRVVTKAQAVEYLSLIEGVLYTLDIASRRAGHERG